MLSHCFYVTKSFSFLRGSLENAHTGVADNEKMSTIESEKIRNLDSIDNTENC